MNESYMDYLNTWVNFINSIVWGWPLIIAFMAVGLIATFALQFVQFRYFFKAWSLVLSPHEHAKSKQGDMNPFQAFVNALSTSIGNGSLAGMATAIHEGGPGAAFWIFVLGFFALPIRFCEVYLSNAFEETGTNAVLGGPMLYLKKVPGGAILPAFYAFFCLMLSFFTGNALQANSVSKGIQNILPMNSYIIAVGILLFVIYVMAGGAARIVKLSEGIVPLKVGIFFLSALIILVYHGGHILEALRIIIESAFTPQAVKGAILGTTMQGAIRFGMSRSLNASEIGLGVAGIFFGSTGSKNPVENGIMSMVSAFISNYLVCFVLCLLIVLTGVWNNPITGIDLTTAAYATVFGSIAGWLVTLLSIIFGIGVLVGYAYIGRECWSYLTGGRFINVYNFLYCAFAFFGSLASVPVVWNATDIVNAGLVTLNLYAILYFMPKIAKGVTAYRNAMQ